MEPLQAVMQQLNARGTRELFPGGTIKIDLRQYVKSGGNAEGLVSTSFRGTQVRLKLCGNYVCSKICEDPLP